MIHVGFMFPGVPKVRDLEPVFDTLGDWIRYSQTGWLLWSDLSSQTILPTLMAAVDGNDLIVIAPIEPGGFTAKLQPWMWNWVRTKIPHIITTLENPHIFKGLPPPAS
jgi:hypothetical protein